jgi:hypothetical protein
MKGSIACLCSKIRCGLEGYAVAVAADGRIDADALFGSEGDAANVTRLR